jgi:hypothetical protein
VPFLDVLAGGEALPLLRDHVDESRAAHRAHGGERVDERIDVVPVDRTEVAEAELLEEDARREERLDALLPLPHERPDGGERPRRVIGEVADGRPHAVVERVALDGDEILRDRADVRRDRHLVVVEDDDDVPVGVAGVVEPLVGEAACQRPVAEDGDDLVIVAANVAAGRDSVGRRDRRPGVPSPEGVVFAFSPLEEAREAILLTQRLQAILAPGEQLVRIALVPDVPHELVARRLERVVQRNRQLDDTQPRADVAAGARADVDQARAHVAGERAELVAAEGAHVGWGLYAVEDRQVHFRHPVGVVESYGPLRPALHGEPCELLE